MARRTRSTTPSDPPKAPSKPASKPAPTRRSTRIAAAQDSSTPTSRASSVVADDQDAGWLLPSILDKIREGILEPNVLTMSQKDAVITTFAGEFRSLRKEKRQPLRDHFMQKRAEEIAPPPPPPPPPPPFVAETHDTDDISDFSTSQLITSTPVPAPQQQQAPDENATPRASFFGVTSFFKRIASPFIARTPSKEQLTPQQQRPQQPLGELPASRKRPAPVEEEPKIYPQAQTFTTSTPAPEQQLEKRREQKTPRARPSSKDAEQETSLATITEHTEMTETNMADTEPTPSTRRRTIASVRRQQTPVRRAQTAMSWNKPLPPREKNADRRLEKVRAYETLKDELKSMEDDPEVQQLIGGRPLKRVKVDKLVKIPHNKPGDASGTYAVPDIDSDDEMEVDADEETRSNIFDTLPAESTPAPAVQAAPRKQTPAAATPAPAIQAPLFQAPVFQAPPVQAPTAPAAATQAPTETVDGARVLTLDDGSKLVLKFPDVGKNPGGRLDRMDNKYATAKFAYGFEHWKATGELLPLF